MDFERLPEQGFSLVLHKMCSQIALYDTDPASRHALDKLQGKRTEKKRVVSF